MAHFAGLEAACFPDEPMQEMQSRALLLPPCLDAGAADQGMRKIIAGSLLRRRPSSACAVQRQALLSASAFQNVCLHQPVS